MYSLPRRWAAFLLVLAFFACVVLASPSTLLAQPKQPAQPAQPFAPAQPSKSATPVLGNANAVAATVNGQPISEATLQRSLERVEPTKRKQARTEMLRYFIENALVEQHLRQLGITVEKAEIDKIINSIKTDLSQEKRDFAKFLAELKITENEFRDKVAEDLRWSRFADRQATEPELRKLFDAEKDLFDGTTVRARHILVSIPTGDTKAEEAAVARLRGLRKQVEDKVATGLAKVTNGDALAREKARTELLIETFGTLAREHSECPSKSRNGDVSWFQRSGFTVASFSQAAFQLQPYQMSDVVKTQFGYHLILLTDRKPGRAVKYEEVREAVKAVYCDRLREQLATSLRTKAQVVIHPEPR